MAVYPCMSTFVRLSYIEYVKFICMHTIRFRLKCIRVNKGENLVLSRDAQYWNGISMPLYLGSTTENPIWILFGIVNLFLWFKYNVIGKTICSTQKLRNHVCVSCWISMIHSTWNFVKHDSLKLKLKRN